MNTSLGRPRGAGRLHLRVTYALDNDVTTTPAVVRSSLPATGAALGRDQIGDRAGSIPDGERVARRQEIARHPTADDPETRETSAMCFHGLGPYQITVTFHVSLLLRYELDHRPVAQPGPKIVRDEPPEFRPLVVRLSLLEFRRKFQPSFFCSRHARRQCSYGAC
jgi:hypothetical protein